MAAAAESSGRPRQHSAAELAAGGCSAHSQAAGAAGGGEAPGGTITDPGSGPANPRKRVRADAAIHPTESATSESTRAATEGVPLNPRRWGDGGAATSQREQVRNQRGETRACARRKP